ncbi:MAG: hypothetical protein V8Q36_06060 [Anaerotignum sp.]
MNFAEEYKRKLRTPEEAVKLVKDGDWVRLQRRDRFSCAAGCGTGKT